MRKTHRVALAATLAAVVLLGLPFMIGWAANHASHAAAPSHGNHGAVAPRRAAADQPACELCGKPIVARSEVVLTTAGDKAEHHYRCIHCALLAARDWQKGDVRLGAQSAVLGERVTWTRTNGAWRVDPASATVLALPEANGDCLSAHLVFADSSEYDVYRSDHPAASKHHPMAAGKVDSILTAGREALPHEAICPVSGKRFEPTAKTQWTVYKGKTYYFCCDNCKPRFTSAPATYVSGKGPRPEHMMQMREGACGGHSGEGGCGGHDGGGCGGGGDPHADHSSHTSGAQQPHAHTT
jgi:YHS domain-containing protein